MPAERLTMRKVKEVLRLKLGQGLSGRTLGTLLPTMQNYWRVRKQG